MLEGRIIGYLKQKYGIRLTTTTGRKKTIKELAIGRIINMKNIK